eukprot:8628650-Heterocapsa_arctica.AAC.1
MWTPLGALVLGQRGEGAGQGTGRMAGGEVHRTVPEGRGRTLNGRRRLAKGRGTCRHSAEFQHVSSKRAHLASRVATVLVCNA